MENTNVKILLGILIFILIALNAVLSYFIFDMRRDMLEMNNTITEIKKITDIVDKIIPPELNKVINNTEQAREEEQMKSRDARRIADIKQLQLGLEMYYDTNKDYPTELSKLVKKFLATLPQDPKTQQPYFYCRISNKDYHIGATLEEANHPALGSDSDDSTCFSGTDPVLDLIADSY